MFAFLSREGCKIEEHHIPSRELRNLLKGHRILMKVLHNLQGHCIHRMELHIRMLGIHCNHIQASCSSLSDGRFCCMHKQRKGHHKMEQEHHNWKLVLHSCLRGHHSPERVLHSLQKEHHSLRKELHKIQQEHYFGGPHTHHYSYSCNPSSCPCPSSSSPLCGRFWNKR